MNLLLKNCDILASDGADGYRWIKNGYLGIDGDTIDYLADEAPRRPTTRKRTWAESSFAPASSTATATPP